MAKYAVRIEEILARTVIVEAENSTEAVNKVVDADISLEYDDYCDRDITLNDGNWADGRVPDGEDVSRYWHLEDSK